MAQGVRPAGPAQWRNHIVKLVGIYSERRISHGDFDRWPEEGLRLYREWLALSGLEFRREKSVAELNNELSVLGTQRKNWERITQYYYHRKLNYIQHAINDERSARRFRDEDTSCSAQPYPQPFEHFQDLNGFFEMTKFLEERGDFEWETIFEEPESRTWLNPIMRLWLRRPQWMRPIEDWYPDSPEPRQQFSSLLRHLLAEYEVPSFMDGVWLRYSGYAADYRYAWVHVARGKNIRSIKNPLLPLSKKSAHYFLSAPEELYFEDALKWAHMKAFNLRPRAIAAMLGSKWRADFDNRPFWDSVLRFLAANPMFAAEQIGPLVDYIYSQKFIGPFLSLIQYTVHEHGEVRGDPPHPGFSMRGRTGPRLLQQMENWHGSLGRNDGALDTSYTESGWSPLEERERSDEDETVIWTLSEILTQKDLLEEGQKMRHCIYSYHARVAAGQCSIWSLRTRREGGPRDEWMTRHLTVHVSAAGIIEEARGFANKLPRGRAESLLRQWANKNKLSFAPHVFL